MEIRAICAVALVLAAVPAARAEASNFYVLGETGSTSVSDLASARPTVALNPFQVIDSISVNQLPFDDSSSFWGIRGGYRILTWLAVDVGYRDLGTFDSAPLYQSGPAELSASQWTAAVVLSRPLWNRLGVRASFGASRTKFDAAGTARIQVLVPELPVFPAPRPAPGIPTGYDVAFESPDDETGFDFEVGPTLSFGRGFEAGLSYARRDTRVLKVESLSLSLSWTQNNAR